MEIDHKTYLFFGFMSDRQDFSEIKVWTPRDISKDTRVFMRIDVNVPVRHERMAAKDSQRLRKVIPEIVRLRARGARVILVAHLGDPRGTVRKDCSLAPLARVLSQELGTVVRFLPHCSFSEVQKVVERLPSGAVILLENIRFHSGEEKNSLVLAREMAACADVYINNAFSVCHRRHASLVGITRYLPAFAGQLLMQEIRALRKPVRHPLVVILGGAKIRTKIPLIKHLGRDADAILLGGGAALTMLYADLGSLPAQEEQFTKASDVKMARSVAKRFGGMIHLPCDVVLHKKKIVDIGPETLHAFSEIIKQARTIIWNGPLGIIEEKHGQHGTVALAESITQNRRAFSLVGGGETVDFLESHSLAENFSYVSTGGGAMLAFLGGEEMPGLVALNRAQKLA